MEKTGISFIRKPVLRHPTEGQIQTGRVLPKAQTGNSALPPPIPSRRPTPSLVKYKNSLRISTTENNEDNRNQPNISISAPTTPISQHMHRHHHTQIHLDSNILKHRPHINFPRSPTKLHPHGYSSSSRLLQHVNEYPEPTAPLHICNVETLIYVQDVDIQETSSRLHTPLSSETSPLTPLQSVPPILPRRKSSLTPNKSAYSIRLDSSKSTMEVIRELCSLQEVTDDPSTYKLFVAQFHEEEDNLSLYGTEIKLKRRRLRELENDEIPLIVQHTFQFMDGTHGSHGSHGYHLLLVHEVQEQSAIKTSDIMREQHLKTLLAGNLVRRLQVIDKEEERAIRECKERYSKLTEWIKRSYEELL